jgi:hypothetical protein
MEERQKEKEEASSEASDSDSDSEGGCIAAVEEIMFLMHEERDGRFGPAIEERITVVYDDIYHQPCIR